jgi:8-oxo-dGTP pyrophosphatase MutT (NUDIX family)
MADAPKIEIQPISRHMDIRLEDTPVVLPAKQQCDIDAYWNGLIAQGKPLRRGEVFALTELTLQEKVLRCRLQVSDYAHHIATQHGRLADPYWCRILYAGALLETTDGYFLLGEMGSQTSSAGRLQLVSGGLDFADVEAGRIDLEANMKREIGEELGLECGDAAHVSDLAPVYLVRGGVPEYAAVAYRVKLAMTKEQALYAYDDFVKRLQEKGEVPELAAVVAVPMTVDGVRGFFQCDARPRIEYLPELFEHEVVNLQTGIHHRE